MHLIKACEQKLVWPDLGIDPVKTKNQAKMIKKKKDINPKSCN